ncbi:MAG: PorP/SprF family type IX secretion system membrane protein [Saprospiraceae bacterium]
MKLFRNLVVYGLILLSGLGLKAQDIHFSQFYMSPLNLNPAMTGVSNCTSRIIGNFRNQWAPVLKSNAYNTYSLSYDQKMPVGRYDYFGIGGALWGDVAGTHNFGTTEGKLSFSYSKKMGGYRKKAHFLVIGAEGGFARRGIDTDKYIWPDYSNIEERIDNPSFYFGDVSAGLLWFSVFDEYTNFYIGAAFHHLNQPNQSFKRSWVDTTSSTILRTIDDNNNLYSKVTIHGGGQFEIQPRISLLPYFVGFIQGPYTQLNLGTSISFALGSSRLNKQSFQIGAYYRLVSQYQSKPYSDALILTTRFEYQNLGFGLSYDATISGLRAASSATNSLELSVIYNICGPEHRGIYCPRF